MTTQRAPVPLGDTLPVAPGTASAGVAVASARADHRHPAQTLAAFAVGVPTARTVALATAYQATDNTKPARVTINLTSTATISLTAGSTNSADVVMGPTNAIATTGGSAMGKYANSNTGALTVGLNLSTVSTNQFTLDIPAGYWFAVRVTAGTVTVVNAFDQSLG